MKKQPAPSKKPADNLRPMYQDMEKPARELLLLVLLGELHLKQVRELAHGRGMELFDFLDQSLHVAFEYGSFDPVGVGDKRTGNDELHTHPDNQHLMVVCGRPSNYNSVVQAGRERQISNRSAFGLGIRHALDCGAF